MKFIQFHSNQTAVAGVIEALLLVALVAIIISTIQLVYIPEIMEQKEADHMDEVENQLSHLKSVIDLQSQAKEKGPISTAITLGSRELPYFVTARAFGRLNHIPKDKSNNNISITNQSGYITLINLSSIKFQSVNAYFLNQNFILESGGVILKQDDGGEAMKIHPPIRFENISNTIFLNWTIHNFSVIGGKDSAEGYKSCYIRTQFHSNKTYIIENVSFINISTTYYKAWNRSLNWLKNQHDDFKENILISRVKDKEIISINTSVNLTANIEIVDINVQIGIGTIMQYPKDN